MAISREFAVQPRVFVGRDTIPAEVRQTDVTEAALQVFNNFVEEIARLTPSTASMKEKTQVRRSERLSKAVDAAPATAPIPTSQKVFTSWRHSHSLRTDSCFVA